MYPKPIQQLISAFSKLPSVGPRTAERYVFWLLKSGKKDVAELTNALKSLIEQVKSCEQCWDFSDISPCKLCGDPKRDGSIICVVKDSQEVQQLEKTGSYLGTYHILRGTIKIDDDRPSFGKAELLFKRAENPKIKEVILALNPDLAGETTSMFLQKKLKSIRPDLIISRLARGLPLGSDVQYADEMTLGSALTHRTKQ